MIPPPAPFGPPGPPSHRDINLAPPRRWHSPRRAASGTARLSSEQALLNEGANLLGPNGFTNGVGPANLGLSFNVNL